MVQVSTTNPSRELCLKKAAKKRSKTFTGCQTCRERSLKCGEERPTCRRCRHSGILCKGYSMALVWPGENVGTKRRYMLQPALSGWPVLSEHSVDKVLSNIDSADLIETLTIDHFSVFPLDSGKSSNLNIIPRDDSEESPISSQCKNEEFTSVSGFDCHVVVPKHSTPDYRNDPLAIDVMAANSLSKSILPGLDPFFIQNKFERLLMHHWSSFLASALTPVPRPDNAFRDIITPMALTAASFNSDSPGHLALLCAFYALLAASKSALREDDREEYSLVSRKYVVRSVRYLRQALPTTDFGEQQAVLAAILILSALPAFVGGSPDWRSHLRGARGWLKTIDAGTWQRSRSASIIYELFVVFATLRPADRRLAKDLDPLKYESKFSKHIKLEGKPSWFCDTIWGITHPAIDIIGRINGWIYADANPTAVELSELELAIYLSDPTYMTFESPNLLCGQITRAHAMLFYYGCHIYFRSALLNRSPRDLQTFVKLAIEEIEKIMTLETGLDVSGIMWPAFITACEAEEEELRVRFMRYFDKREQFGLANVTDAKRVILEVWSRRDKTGSEKDVSWHDVMVDLGIDIILS